MTTNRIKRTGCPEALYGQDRPPLPSNKGGEDKKMKRINTQDLQPFESQHAAIIRSLSPECMVLLKNEGILPMAKGGKLALYGSGARATIKGGTGSGDVNVRKFVNVEEGLENAGFEITTKDWLDAYDKVVAENKAAFYGAIRKKADEAGANPVMFALGAACPEPEYEFPLTGEGDTAVYVLARISGEGSDRKPVAGDINLTETEIRDINKLNAAYKNFVLVLNTGGMVDLTPVADARAILIMGQLGMASGDALADVLTGAAYPSGKLTMTWAPIDAYPSTEGFGDPSDTYYKEGIYVGYRYFDTAGEAPTYPFGYGIGYTTFSVESKGIAVKDGEITVTALVTNTGKAAGKEVVQVYYSAPAGEIDKPFQELAGYAKTAELKAGECQEVSVTFPISQMASYCEKCAAWVLEEGTYYIRVGNCSRSTVVAGAVALTGKAVVEKDMNIGGESGFEDLKLASAACECDAAVEPIQVDPSIIETKTVEYAPLMEELPAGEPFSFKKVLSGEKTLDEFISGLTDDQLAYLCIGTYQDIEGDILEVIGNAANHVAGGAGETTSRLDDLDVPPLIMADGPAGLRLSKEYHVNEDGTCKGTASLGGDMMHVFTEEELAGMAAAALATEDPNQETFYQYCSAIPIGTGIAQSFNDDLAAECGRLVGEEMAIFGIDIWLAPALNIMRSPLCGRDFEYFSEDPLVSGRMAAGITRGVQAFPGRAVTIKHFACNNQETDRYFSNSLVSERALREIYLKGFEICVKETQPKYIMTSYNLINGEHACNMYDINTRALRDEWGFKGVVMTDWLVTGGMGPKGPKYPCASAAGNVKAGNEITMPGIPSDKADIMAALADENHAYHLTRAHLQLCAKRVLAMTVEMVTAK